MVPDPNAIGVAPSVPVPAAPVATNWANLGILAVVAAVIAVGGTLILNWWKSIEKAEGDRIKKDSNIEESARYMAKRLRGKKLSDVSDEELASMHEEAVAQEKRTKGYVRKDSAQGQHNTAVSFKKAQAENATGTAQYSTEFGYGIPGPSTDPKQVGLYLTDPSNLFNAQDHTDQKTRGAYNRLLHRGVNPNLNLKGVGEGLSDAGVLFNSDDVNAKLRTKIIETEQEKRKNAMKEALEMTESIRKSERALTREINMGTVSKEEAINRWLSIKKRSVEAGMSEDDISRVSEKVRTAQIAAMHQEMYDKVGKARDMDAAKGELSFTKKLDYLKQELEVIDRTTISRAEYNRRVAERDDIIAQKTKFAASEMAKGHLGAAGATAMTIAKLLTIDPAGKDAVRSDEDEKARNAKIKEDVETRKSYEKYSRSLEASDLQATGRHLEAKILQAKIHYREQMTQVDKNSKEAIKIQRELNIAIQNLRIDDKLAFQKIEDEKLAYRREVAKHTIDREKTQFEYDMTRGTRDPAKQSEIREKSKQEAIKDAKESTKAQVRAIDEELEKRNKTANERLDLESKKAILKSKLKETIKDIEQGSGITKQQQEDARNKEDLENQYGTASNRSSALDHRETLLQKRMGQAKSVDKIDSVGKAMEQNLKAQYEAQASMIDLKEKEDSMGKSTAQQEIIRNRAAQDRLKLQESFLQKMQDVTAEMQKQKGMLDTGKSGFTMGGIYNSYEEIVKHDMGTSGKFKSQYDSSGGGSDPNFDLARSVAAGKLGIPAGSLERTTVDRGNELGVGNSKPGDIVKAQQDAAARQTMGMPKRIPLRGSASYDAMQAARALDAWGSFPIAPEGLHKNMVSGAKGAGSEGTGGDQQITIPVTVNIGGQSYSQTQSQVVKKSPMNYKHPKGGI